MKKVILTLGMLSLLSTAVSAFADNPSNLLPLNPQMTVLPMNTTESPMNMTESPMNLVVPPSAN